MKCKSHCRVVTQWSKVWVNLVSQAAEGDCDPTSCEKKGVILSLENLKSFPWIEDGVAQGTLSLHGWYFDIASGTLSDFDPDNNNFAAIE